MKNNYRIIKNTMLVNAGEGRTREKHNYSIEKKTIFGWRNDDTEDYPCTSLEEAKQAIMFKKDNTRHEVVYVE